MKRGKSVFSCTSASHRNEFELSETEDVSGGEGAWKPPRAGSSLQAGYPTEAGTWIHIQRVHWLIPSNSKQNNSGAIILFLQLCGGLFSNLAAASSASRFKQWSRIQQLLIQDAREEAWASWLSYVWEDEEGETCTSWELIMLQHHKIGEKRTNLRSEHWWQSPPERAQGAGIMLWDSGVAPQCVPLATTTTTSSRAGERGRSALGNL